MPMTSCADSNHRYPRRFGLRSALLMAGLVASWAGLFACGHSHSSVDAHPDRAATDGESQATQGEETQAASDRGSAKEVGQGLPELDGSASEAGTDSGAGRVNGRIVARLDQGGGGRLVVIGGQRTTTGANGSFSFDHVPATYDVIIVEPKSALVSIYYGLTRRDPILYHEASPDAGWYDGVVWRQATISGTLSGDFPMPIDPSHAGWVHFHSTSGSGGWGLGQPLLSGGPDYGPMIVRWESSSSISGSLLAIGTAKTGSDFWGSAFLAIEPFSLTDGDKAVKDLTLKPIPTGRLAGSVRMYPGNRLEQAQFSFRFPDDKREMGLGLFDSTGVFDVALPDLTALGGDYCVSIMDFRGRARGEKCGAKLGMTDFTIDVQAPPQMQNPADGSVVTKDTAFSWSPIKGGVYMVDFLPDSPDPAARHIHVYTSATETRWPSLDALGLPFLSGTKCTVQVVGLFPYAAMDDLAQSRGLIGVGEDRQELDSAAIKVTSAK